MPGKVQRPERWDVAVVKMHRLTRAIDEFDVAIRADKDQLAHEAASRCALIADQLLEAVEQVYMPPIEDDEG
jgi:hypothetical protein